jgi:hypothetical protein
MLFAEIAEILRLDQLPPESIGPDHPALQPAPVSPFLHFVYPDVQSFPKELADDAKALSRFQRGIKLNESRTSAAVMNSRD